MLRGVNLKIGAARFSRTLGGLLHAGIPLTESLRITADSSENLLVADALRQVVPAASRDEARPILTGVLMAAESGGLRLVATDSYRLSVRDLPGTSVLQEGQTVLVPSRALAELNRVVSGADQVTLRLASDEASFEVGETRLTTRLIEGDFPNYRQLIPQSYPNRLIVGKEPFLNAIRRVKLLAKDATPVRLTLRPDGLELFTSAQQCAQTRRVDEVQSADVDDNGRRAPAREAGQLLGESAPH